MNDTINDWKPETRSLIKSLTDAGFTIESGNNGEYKFQFKGDLPKFLEDLLACDEAHLYIKCPNSTKTWLFLVLGNSPGEIVSDYGVPRDTADAELLDKVTSAHYDKWEGRKQPTCPNPYIRRDA